MGITLNWRIGILCLIYYFALNRPSATAAPFKCNSNTTTTCTSVVDYRLPNTTTISAVQSLFNVSNFFSLLGANNLPLSTLPNQSYPANSTLKIPFPCRCNNGLGISDRIPTYFVVPDDGLSHIAVDIFSGLVNFTEIQIANNIVNADRILVGQELRIPLPCSCDDVDGRKVVHYGHLVAPGSSVEGIAEQYNTSPNTLLSLNNLASPRDLIADTIIDVPLRACDSSVGSTSPDSPLLVSSGTYAITARDCVQCSCDSRTWTLSCLRSQLNSSSGRPCPPIISCDVSGGLSVGLGITTTVQGCNTTTCAYAGYTNETILANSVLVSTSCPAPPNGRSSSSMNSQSWKFNAVFIIVQVLLLLCL